MTGLPYQLSLINTEPDRVEFPKGIIGIQGRNFSGRTQFLRRRCGLPDSIFKQNRVIDTENKTYIQGAYVGPDIHNYISGLSPTVDNEIRLHQNQSLMDDKLLRHFIRQVNFQNILQQNPFTLSGGEQVILSVLSAIAFSPDVLSLDCPLEQLSISNKQLLIQCLVHNPYIQQVFLCDNRLQEYQTIFQKINNIYRQIQLNENTSNTLKTLTCSYTPQACELILQDIHFQYRKNQTLLQDINAHFIPGNIYYIKGPNGSGKSTLAKLLCGILKPISGTISKNHREILPWKYPARDVAYHSQNPDLQIFNTTVKQEINTHQTTELQQVEKTTENFYDALINAFGLRELLNKHPMDLAFVLRKRVAMAATIAMQKPWIVLDEPTLGQDDESCQYLARSLKVLSTNGVGIIIISHSVWFETLLPGTSLHISNGVLTTQDSAATMLKSID